MINEWLFFGSMVLYFGLVLLFYKLFGKTGLYVLTALTAVLSSIEASKIITLFGISVTLGNVAYSSSFLITDILSENYGKKAANASVAIGILTAITWVLTTTYLIMFIPNSDDFISANLDAVFGFVPRISLASVFTYAISQALDISIYHHIWKLCGNSKKLLWLRNNVSTLASQLIDTVIFTLLAFYGAVENDVLITLIISTYVFKIAIAIIDTPIAYLARRFANSKNADFFKVDILN